MCKKKFYALQWQFHISYIIMICMTITFTAIFNVMCKSIDELGIIAGIERTLAIYAFGQIALQLP